VSGLLPFARPEFATISVAISVFAFFVIKNLRFAITLWVIEFLIALLMTGLVWFCFGALIPQSAQAKAVFLQHDHRYDALLQCGKILAAGHDYLFCVRGGISWLQESSGINAVCILHLRSHNTCGRNRGC